MIVVQAVSLLFGDTAQPVWKRSIMRHECNLFKVEKKNPNQEKLRLKNSKRTREERDRSYSNDNDWEDDYNKWYEEPEDW